MTFLALNEFLGLGHELINQVSFSIFSTWYNVTLVCTFIIVLTPLTPFPPFITVVLRL